MKLNIPISLLILVVFCVLISRCVKGQLPRATSDATAVRGGMPALPMPNQALTFVPPNDMMMVAFHTSTIPIIVRVEVSSNVWRRSLWWHQGQMQTNDTLIASNLISATTNIVQ